MFEVSDLYISYHRPCNICNLRENMYNLSRPSEQISGSSKIIVDSKNNISDEQLEISVKTFFGHELKVIANADGSYSITAKGLKGLIDKILLPIFSKELDIRKAEIVNDDIYSDAKGQIDKGKLKSRNDLLNFLGKKGINTDNLPYNDTIKLTKLLDLVDANDKNKLTEEELALVKKSEEVADLKKEKAEEDFIEKMSNIIPKGYRVTSSKTGDKIEGDGNCFYRAIAKLEKKDQEKYGDVRKKIFDEIGKYCPESNEEQAEKIDNNLKDLIKNYAVENKLECSFNEVDDLLAVLIQIREHVGNADNKNRYAGHIEAYFYAKATKNAVIIYDSIGQMTAFIPDKEGKDMQVKSLSAKETEDQQKIENFVKNNSINVAAAVKLACNTVGPHYEAIVPVDVKN